jgi:lipid-A-disaccharide synthase
VVPLKILVSAGEASGDLYASKLVEAVRARLPGAEFFGCTGPRMRAAGVRTVVDAASLAVVGLFEVVSHIPRIYREFQSLIRAAESEGPDLAILTDSPDFNLRVARRLHRLGVPVFYLVAPQVWAWRRGRLPGMRRNLQHLLCIFPFEEQFFKSHGIPATYIGHPLAHFVRPELTREEFRRRHSLSGPEPVIALLPGSRHGEVSRHLPALLDAAARIAAARPSRFLLALPAGRFVQLPELTYFTERNPAVSIQVIEGATWDVLAWSDLALAASGTVTVEATLLGTPMVVFYRVSQLSWLAGKFLVRVPFYSMPNLIAGQAVVPELMQNEVSGERLAAEALRLLEDEAALAVMRRDLASVAARLAPGDDPMARAAAIVEDFVRQSSKSQLQ